MQNKILAWNRANADCFSTVGYKIFEFNDISSRAKELVKQETVGTGDCEPFKHYRVYPFEQLNIGQAFYVLWEENKIGLQNCVDRAMKKTGRQFKVLRHAETKCSEVVRVK